MHGHKKSDSTKVAMKPANKNGKPGAVARGETKGNADRQNTYRVQDRISVSHALERTGK